jgi:hypothetical protein
MIQQLLPVSSHVKTVAEFTTNDKKVRFSQAVEAWALVGVDEEQRVTALLADHKAKGLITIEQFEQMYNVTCDGFDEEAPEIVIEDPITIRGLDKLQ